MLGDYSDLANRSLDSYEASYNICDGHPAVMIARACSTATAIIPRTYDAYPPFQAVVSRSVARRPIVAPTIPTSIQQYLTTIPSGKSVPPTLYFSYTTSSESGLDYLGIAVH